MSIVDDVPPAQTPNQDRTSAKDPRQPPDASQTGSPTDEETVSPTNPRDTLIPVYNHVWSPSNAFDNEVRLLARVVKREKSIHHGAVHINFELAAWLICHLIEVKRFDSCRCKLGVKLDYLLQTDTHLEMPTSVDFIAKSKA